MVNNLPHQGQPETGLGFLRVVWCVMEVWLQLQAQAADWTHQKAAGAMPVHTSLGSAGQLWIEIEIRKLVERFRILYHSCTILVGLQSSSKHPVPMRLQVVHMAFPTPTPEDGRLEFLALFLTGEAFPSTTNTGPQVFHSLS